MSTIPTEITAATEGSLDIASIKSVMDGFDPASLLPDLSKVFGSLVGVCRVAVMIGPVIALILGLAYLFLAPKEANYYFGYRCYFGMGSVRRMAVHPADRRDDPRRAGADPHRYHGHRHRRLRQYGFDGHGVERGKLSGVGGGSSADRHHRHQPDRHGEFRRQGRVPTQSGKAEKSPAGYKISITSGCRAAAGCCFAVCERRTLRGFLIH